MSVVQLECAIAAQLRAARAARVGHRKVKDLITRFEGAQERLFLGGGHRVDPTLFPFQLGILRRHG